MQTQKRIDIQVMRAVAVLAVVAFHASKEWFPKGYLGVDVFFVISGFLICALISASGERQWQITIDYQLHDRQRIGSGGIA